ncbi:hypothetical protein BH23VER1_BH23VER1_07240 [soil metagenome]
MLRAMAQTVEQIESEILALPPEERFRLRARLEASLCAEAIEPGRKAGIDRTLAERLDGECVAFPDNWRDQVRAGAGVKRSGRLGHA